MFRGIDSDEAAGALPGLGLIQELAICFVRKGITVLSVNPAVCLKANESTASLATPKVRLSCSLIQHQFRESFATLSDMKKHAQFANCQPPCASKSACLLHSKVTNSPTHIGSSLYAQPPQKKPNDLPNMIRRRRTTFTHLVVLNCCTVFMVSKG